ncbi:glucokinase [Orenia metallireducens]|uniref:Glucokinase n=1 Tax=Orenia metallireducens TaxID=1413210 RepID=A0A285H4R3_9FIRM|nr:ROK family protein [Orenia metallireducens]PRX28625.1 glucokinase [Orenia metallireducens]SNY30870.1 glucokinase [Orenia metallireducens]
MQKEYVVGVDLGGTKILTAVADLEGNILARVRKDTEAKKGKEVVIQKIKDTVYEAVQEVGIELSQVKGIGLGVPGPVDIKKGIIKHTPNLDLDNINIVEELRELDTPIFLENDANAAALGEKWFGAGKEAENMVYMTVSTGIGGGIIINKEIFHGAGDAAGEIGHMTILPDSKLQCGCGNYGCWEAIASGTALSKLGKEAVESGKDTLMSDLVADSTKVNGAVVAKAAEQGDKVAKEIMDKIAGYLGIGMANLINIFNPDTIVIGGGVSQSWGLIEDKVNSTIQARAMDSLVEDVDVVIAELGSDVGVLGAVATALAELDLF